jgi:hypothetical protein
MELHSGVWKFGRAQFSSCIVRRHRWDLQASGGSIPNHNSFVWYLIVQSEEGEKQEPKILIQNQFQNIRNFVNQRLTFPNILVIILISNDLLSYIFQEWVYECANPI